MKTKSTVIFALLCAVAQGAWAQASGESISYIDRQWDAVNKTVVETERTISTYTEITGQKETLNQWYTLDGRRLTGKPTARGLYYNNGKKVIIK